MNIFEKRPLGLVLCAVLSGFSLFALLSPLMRAILVGFAIALILFSFVFKRENALLKIISISLLTSFVASFLYFDVHFYPTELYGDEVEISGRVLDAEKSSDAYQSLILKTTDINSEKQSLKMSVNVYGYYDEIKPGSYIAFTAEVEGLSKSEGFNFKQYYTSRGICATADINSFTLKSVDKTPISYKCKLIRERISERSESLSNVKAGSMLSALLLGERDRLSGQLNLDFLRTGITHILALSGTHVVILAAAVDRMLAIFRMDKKYRLLLGCVFTFLFMALTGFPLSVCRAGIMLILSTLLFLLTGCKDSITSLLMASALIIIVSPYASQDVGLWLSILATFGILIAAEILNENYSYEDGGIKAIRYVLLSLMYSLFAISATVIVSTLCFTGTSVLGAVATLVFSVLTELYVYVGIAMLLFGNVVPIGKLMIIFEDFISNLVGRMSDLSFAYSSSEFSLVKALFITLGIAFAVFALAKIERKKLYLTSLCILFVFANVLPIGMTNQKKSRDQFLVSCSYYDSVLLRENGKTLLFDISNSSKNAAYNNNYLLIKENVVELDCYAVANYYDSLPESLDKVLSSNLVKEVKLPMPRSDKEENIAIEVFRSLSDYRTTLSFYEDLVGINFFCIDIIVPFRTNNLSAILFKRNEEIYTYLSEGLLEAMPKAYELMYVSDYIIFGSYGEAYTNQITVDEYDKRLKAVVSFDRRIEFDTSSTEWQSPKLYIGKDQFYFYK